MELSNAKNVVAMTRGTITYLNKALSDLDDAIKSNNADAMKGILTPYTSVVLNIGILIELARELCKVVDGSTK